MTRARAALLGATAALALAAVPARANTFAAVERGTGRADSDIGVIDATTGTSVPLPPGVNTTEDEVHPTISLDGQSLAFERRNPATGAVRIIVADLSAGTTTDLFNGFESAEFQPTDPAIDSTGDIVETGGPFQQLAGEPGFTGLLTLTLAAGGQHQQLTGVRDAPSGGVTDQLAIGGDPGLVAFRAVTPSRGGIYLHTGSGVTGPVHGARGAAGHPAMAATDPQYVLFDDRALESHGTTLGPGEIEFRPVAGFQGNPIPLTGVNTAADESEPAVTPDGRFVAFIRHGGDGRDRLFMWDSQTQELLNAGGISVGAIDSRDRDGSVSLYVVPTFAGPIRVSPTSISAGLDRGSGVGILVQRILGKHKVLGRTEYRLRKVGRVPLGRFKKGRHHIRWGLRIGGKRLKPGRYLLTLRALNRHGIVTDLAKPRAIRIRARHRHKNR